MAVILRCSVSLELERRQERPEKGGSPIYRLDHGHRDGHGMVGNLDGFSLRLITYSLFTHTGTVNCGNVETTSYISYFSIRTVLTF